MKKNSCTPINPKKYSCYGVKKIHTRNLITKKNSCGSKIPLPPYNFSNGPSLCYPSLNYFRHRSFDQTSSFLSIFLLKFSIQVPVVERLGSAIHRINRCAILWIVIYPVDSLIHISNNCPPPPPPPPRRFTVGRGRLGKFKHI